MKGLTSVQAEALRKEHGLNTLAQVRPPSPVKIFLNQKHIETGQKLLTNFSMLFSIILVLCFIMTRMPYACTMAFLLLIIKSILLFKADTFK